jgi:guanine nucleotide exchange factor VAV
MIKLTSIDHDDRLSLEAAKDAMVDINNYINEVKRDWETQQIIRDIQNSIVDLDMVCS